jgi:hypothetical protein
VFASRLRFLAYLPTFLHHIVGYGVEHRWGSSLARMRLANIPNIEGDKVNARMLLPPLQE